MTADENGRTVSVFLGNGAGDFTDPVSYTVGGFPIGVATGDFDHDGNRWPRPISTPMAVRI
jgi:hypothetical protein